MTTADSKEKDIASHWNHEFKKAMVAKAPYTKRWREYFDAYSGDYFKNKKRPDYKSDLVSNYIFSIIETIRPIMLDNDPKFQAMPRQPDGMAFANDLNEAFGYEWDRENMSPKLWRELVNTLVAGTSIFFTPYDTHKKEIKAIPVNPFNFFPDPLATDMDNGQYYIYADYYNVYDLKRRYPNKAKELVGDNIKYSELVQENNKDTSTDSQVLVLEVYHRDHKTVETDKETNQAILRYPNGRVTTVCPELGLVLKDAPLPYNDKKFPFVLMKSYDVPGKFWGEGEVAQLLSPQKHMNELNNAIIDNAKTTANVPWIVDRNAGIPEGAITSRPGLVVRKNPGSEVRRDQPPSMPAYVGNAVESMKHDMEQVSGIFDSLKGNSETGVYTAQGILALQEAGQARIRLKVKLMEDALGRLGEMWFSRMKQFWKEDKWVRMVKADGSYDFKKLKTDAFKLEYDIRILAGSTMPVNKGAMLDFMVRLAQTQMPDGQALVDREAVAEYLPMEVKSAMLARMEDKGVNLEQQLGEITQALQEMGQMVQQTQQGMQQLAEEMKQADASIMDIIEELSGAVEKINGDIVQTQEENAKLHAEKEKEAERHKLKEEGYNAGFSDAEKYVSEGLDQTGEGDSPIPDDMLNGIEDMSDDELAVLLESNPELADLLQ